MKFLNSIGTALTIINPFNWGSSQPLSHSSKIAQNNLSQLSALHDYFTEKQLRKRNVISLSINEHVLRVNGHTGITQEELLQQFEQHPNLTVIEIAGLAVNDEILKEIAKRYPQLRKLNVSECTALTKDGFDALAAGCKNILQLHTSNLNIPDGGYNELLKANPDLREWSVNSDYVVGAATSVGIATLEQLSNNKNLTIFNASGCYAPTSQNRESAFISFINACPSIQVLNLAIGWSDLTDESLNIIASLKEIRKLSLYMSSENFTADGVTRFLQNTADSLRNFSAPDISFNFNDEQMTTILNAIPAMERLQIGGLQNISADVLNLFKNCTHLDKLMLTRFKELGGEQLAGIINSLPKLRDLELIAGDFIDGSFLTMIDNPSLSSLSLQSYTDISSWAEFNNAQVNLQGFSLSGQLKGNTSTEIFDFIKANPNLKKLNLSIDHALTSEQLLQLENTQLVLFSLNSPSSIDEATMAQFIEKNPNLEAFWYAFGENGPNLMQALSSLEALRKFQVSFDSLNSADSQGLEKSNLESLISVSEKCNVVWSYLYKLPANPQIERDLPKFIEKNNILNFTIDSSDLSSESIVNAISKRPTQKKIYLMSTNLTPEGMNSILGMCKALSLLTIKSNIITQEDVDKANEQYPDVIIQYYKAIK